jgi:hypothetical protein
LEETAPERKIHYLYCAVFPPRGLRFDLEVFRREEDAQVAGEEIEVARAIESLLSSVVDSSQFPAGFTLVERVEAPPSDWERRHQAVTSVLWRFTGPDTFDSILFAIFPSTKESTAAWAGGRPHLPTPFKVRSVTTPEDLGEHSRLYDGAAMRDGKAVNGFSECQVLFGNIIVRAYTASGATADSANAHAAVLLASVAIATQSSLE